MSSKRPVPLGTYRYTAKDGTSTQIPVQPEHTADLKELLTDVLNADRVDILGVFPAQFGHLLAELVQEQRPGRMPKVRYLTPAQERVSLYREPGVLGTLVQRWLTGLTSLRNWLEPRPLGESDPTRLEVFEFDDLYLDCLLWYRTGGVERAAIVTQLPILPAESDQDPAVSTVLASSLSEPQVPYVRDFIGRYLERAARLVPRQLRCASSMSTDEPGGFRPVIARIAPYGRLVPDDVEPIAVTVVTAKTASGPSVVLKQRTEANSRDDFDTLSLLSERVLLDDVKPGIPEVNRDHALDALWVAAGQPDVFEIPEDGFRRAAQRELFLSCGLDVAVDRFSLRTTFLLDREGEDTYLGFYVFVLELNRGAPIDELDYARRWNRDLRVVPFRELYGRSYRDRLNRLLRRREGWLREHVFR
jgi:hypothetical protein